MRIGMRHEYEAVKIQCEDYLDRGTPEFVVSATKNEILEEQKKAGACFSLGVCESYVLFRKICEKMVEYNGFFFHSAVVMMDGSAYAFSGESGTGKTTHANLWCTYFEERAKILNGDKPIICWTGNEFYAYGTPWCGKEGQAINTAAPLKGICFLQQGEENKIVRMTPGTVLPQFLSQTVIPKERDKVALLLTLFEQLIKTVPCYQLKCNISEEAVKVAYERLSDH
ncbi:MULTISPECIES: hypothetical protein [Eubacterium]|uniref:hypothetical protein n=1 Tax=Eubacterium TaxID=1730 RepID=UPI0011C22376|nr:MULTISPECIES: hypothetical protein [Eubacterium]